VGGDAGDEPLRDLALARQVARPLDLGEVCPIARQHGRGLSDLPFERLG
jgi:hypothetical protein